MLRRSWNGVDVSLLDTPAGATRVGASRRHWLAIHAGRPVRASCRFDHRGHHRLQSRGDIDLVPAGVPGVWEDDRATRLLRIGVTPALLEAAAGGARVELVPQYQLRDPQLEHLAWAFEAELQAPGPGEPLYGDSLGMALAAHLVRRYATSSAAARAVIAPRGGLSRPQLARVTELIEGQLERRLTLVELAAAAGVSPSHFKALFKRSTGSPVHRYVVARRVERARALLLEGDAAIAEVALQVGFADQSHLARWMRRVAGVTPRELVRRGR
jgi:AraC family transcriptional regulator